MRFLSAADNLLLRARPPLRPKALAMSDAFMTNILLSAKHDGKRRSPMPPRSSNSSGSRSAEGWTVCASRDSSFQGSSRRFDANVNDLRNSGWNDRITSFRVGSRGYSHGWNSGGAYGGGGFGSSPGGGNLELFGDVNFRGRRQTLTGNTPDVRAVGMGSAISSLRLPSGGAWQVCTEPNYRGRCQVVSRDVSDLRPGDWNDVIASARRLR